MKKMLLDLLIVFTPFLCFSNAKISGHSLALYPALVGPLPAQVERTPPLDVPYVPTPREVVGEMLKMAGVTSRDIIYDLGCGDGRIVITAAKELGARGIGVDKNPVRIRECEENAAQEQVGNLVTFQYRDLFDADFREATVVTLYLLPDVNLKLRPKFFDELRPGTRVVSHDFDMDEWIPDRIKHIGTHSVYYWVIPANFSGTWNCSMTSLTGGQRQATLQLKQKFQKIEGTLRQGVVDTPIEKASITGRVFRFTVNSAVNGRKTPVNYVGRITDDNIEGIIERRASRSIKTQWKAQRRAGTKTDIAPDG